MFWEGYILPIYDLEDRFKRRKFTIHGEPISQRSTPITPPKGQTFQVNETNNLAGTPEYQARAHEGDIW
jgi:hypothetical protein